MNTAVHREECWDDALIIYAWVLKPPIHRAERLLDF
jgi:hypothetical protein